MFPAVYARRPIEPDAAFEVGLAEHLRAVVTRDVSPRSIVAGVAARVFRDRRAPRARVSTEKT